MTSNQGRLGILVGGGPAPGINSAISGATIEAIKSGLEVVGVFDGYQHLIEGQTEFVRPLTISEVAHIHVQGGSILRTSRANPASSPAYLKEAVNTLKKLDIGYLVTIGGDDTAFGAFEIFKAAEGSIRVAHIPKTIDNDLPLPGNSPTFGFETARQLGTQLAMNLIEDSCTTNRWYIISVMGRKAGHLALGIGKAAGATLTIIPEEFPQERIRLSDVRKILEGAIFKRRAQGLKHGLAVVAEGVTEKLEEEELENLPGVHVTRDQYGHIRLDEIPIETILKKAIQERFKKRGENLAIVDRTIGYELRSAPPIPFDIDYTRTLGYAAVRLLLTNLKNGHSYKGGMVYLRDGQSDVLPFDQLQDSSTGRTRVRMVDINGEYYRVARRYMTRLEMSDFEDTVFQAKLSDVSGMTVQELEETLTPVL